MVCVCFITTTKRFWRLGKPNSKTNSNPPSRIGYKNIWKTWRNQMSCMLLWCVTTNGWQNIIWISRKDNNNALWTHTSSDSSSSSSSSTAWPPYLESGTPFLFPKFVSKMSWVLFISQRACRMQGGGSSVWASSKSTHKSHPFTYLGLYQCLSISIKWCYNYLECS